MARGLAYVQVGAWILLKERVMDDPVNWWNLNACGHLANAGTTFAADLRALAAHYRREGMREAAEKCERLRVEYRGYSGEEHMAETCRNAILADAEEVKP